MKRAILCLMLIAPPIMGPAQQRPPPRPNEMPPVETGPPGAPVSATNSQWQNLRESAAEYAACRLALSLLGTKYEELPAITDEENPGCGIPRPIKVSQILPGVSLSGAPVLRCATVRALGFWTRDFVMPAAAALPKSPRLTTLETGAGYACRSRVGTETRSVKLSEHALGNALDITAFLYDDGYRITVQPRQNSGDVEEAFQRSVRAAGCLWFSTVLGPGSNDAHADHLHFDLQNRKNGWRLCE